MPSGWGLSVSTIERLRARGDRNLPPHVVIGPQSIRYDEAVVEAWLAARMHGAAEVAPVPDVPAPPPKVHDAEEALREASSCAGSGGGCFSTVT